MIEEEVTVAALADGLVWVGKAAFKRLRGMREHLHWRGGRPGQEQTSRSPLSG